MKTALLVIDCQNDFLKGASSYSCEMFDKQLAMRIKQLIDWCRKQKITTAYTQHSIKPDKSNAELGEPKDVRACIVGTRGWQIVEDITPNEGDYIINKDKYDAFLDTNLDEVLKKHKIKSIILAGVLTNNCIRATAEGAHYRRYKLTIVSDCCGATSYIDDKTHEEIHDITLRDLQQRIYDTKLVKLEDLKTQINKKRQIGTND